MNCRHPGATLTDVPTLPMVLDLLSSAVKAGAVEKGLAGSVPGSPATYLAMGHLYFDTIQDFENSFGPNADKILGDIPNFTNIQPIIQVSEVVI